MGFDLYSQSHYLVDAAEIEKVSPDQLKAFNDSLTRLADRINACDAPYHRFPYLDVLDMFAQQVCDYYDVVFGNTYGFQDELDATGRAYADLVNHFAESTLLDLYLFYVGGGENGSQLRDGVHWAVDGVMQKTPAALAFEQRFGRELRTSTHTEGG